MYSIQCYSLQKVLVLHLTKDPDTSSTSKRDHPSHVHLLLDRYLHSDSTAVIFQHSREKESKASPEFFFT